MKKSNAKVYIRNLVLAAMFLAIGLVLPFLTGQIPQIGQMMLPMHIPVLLCGFICGWQYGAVVGFIMPLLRFALFSAPPMPGALAMAFELATYGLVAGLLYGLSKWKCVIALYRSLLIAMVAGRVVWAAARLVMMGLGSAPFSWELFLSGALTTAIPGIILQLVLIPGVMAALGRAKLVPFHWKKPRAVPVERDDG